MLGLCAALAAFAPCPAMSGPAPDAIVGDWLVESGDAIVRIQRHGEHYRGRLAWLAEARYPPGHPSGRAGEPVVDRHNPDPELRDRPLLGLTILEGLEYRDGRWLNGHVYNTETGKTYRCRVRLVDRDTLRLRGYIGIPLMGSGTTWTRVQGAPPEMP